MAEKIEGRERAERKKHKLNILIFNDNVIILKFVKLHILNKTDIDIFNKTCIGTDSMQFRIPENLYLFFYKMATIFQ